MQLTCRKPTTSAYKGKFCFCSVCCVIACGTVGSSKPVPTACDRRGGDGSGKEISILIFATTSAFILSVLSSGVGSHRGLYKPVKRGSEPKPVCKRQVCACILAITSILSKPPSLFQAFWFSSIHKRRIRSSPCDGASLLTQMRSRTRELVAPNFPTFLGPHAL